MSTLYKLTNGTSILKLDGDEYSISIPADENNEDYQAYLDWRAVGNVAEAADHVPEFVVYIPKLTIVDRLIALGKLSDALTALNSDTTKKARWDAATEIAIDDEDVIEVLTAIGITDISTVLY